ncbi:hypothetical protein [Hoyosella altamirensis]|uniref:Uncharacterized protein n=1 Tax=Hoyosella altamirensis TaxID=616997 RepID=A0A839RT13_9ACTN|nr:hypothetical protein [Hoyosella altamirensis]MBB3038981.1 hypothetical protein [Hoyosella altamirensis]
MTPDERTALNSITVEYLGKKLDDCTMPQILDAVELQKIDVHLLRAYTEWLKPLADIYDSELASALTQLENLANRGTA